MAGKNEVTLTFAGDSKMLERAIDKVGSSTKELEGDFEKVARQGANLDSSFDKVGQSAKSLEGKLDGSMDSAKRLDRIIGEGGRSFGGYGKGLGGVGDRADEVDTRMMGLSDGIQGVTDLMGGNGKLKPHEMAMAFSDLGSATYNTLIPSLQDASKGMKNLFEQIGGLKGLVVGGALLGGIAALAYSIKQADDAANAKNLGELAERLQDTDYATTNVNMAMVHAAAAMGKVNDAFDLALEKGPRQAEEFIELAAASGVNSDALEEMRNKLDSTFDSQDKLSQSIRDTTDALRAQNDPVFAVIDADRRMQEANLDIIEATQGVNDAIAEFGRGSVEHAEASRALTDAQLAGASAGLDQETAIRELSQAMIDSGASVQGTIDHLQGLADKGAVAQSSVDAVTIALRGVPDRVETTVRAHTSDAMELLRAVGLRIEQLDGSVIDVAVNAHATSTGRIGGVPVFATGGVVPEYFQHGGIRGTDRIPAMLTPGEMILNDSQQAALWRQINGGGNQAALTNVMIQVAGLITESNERLFDIARYTNQSGDKLTDIRKILTIVFSDQVKLTDFGVRGTGGGQSASRGNVTINVQGSILSERDLVAVIRNELHRGGFGGLR